MKTNRKYVVAVALLTVLALVFGVFGTVAPPLADEIVGPEPQQESSSESVGHFQNPPTYDSGWVDISTMAGEFVTLRHDLNTSEVVVDITGKQSLDPTGALVWSKNYGGSGDQEAYSMIQTADGGYALVGGNSSAGNANFCLVKANSAGIMQWSRNYGGADYEEAYSLVQTIDGGYAMAGYNYSAGSYYFCLVKADSAGVMQWSRNYGVPTGEGLAYSLVQTADGGYAMAGLNYSAGSYDFCLVKTDSAGAMQWSENYGGARHEEAYSVIQTSDGGYAMAGINSSLGGYSDFSLVKTDSAGAMQWNKNYGVPTSDEGALSMVQTIDGGYAMAGFNRSAGSYYFCLVKADSGGTVQWSKNYGIPTGTKEACSVVQTIDGGYALAGSNYSAGSGRNFCLVKADSDGVMRWSKDYGGTGYEEARSIAQTSDGSYTLAGYTDSFGHDFLLVKVKGEMDIEHKKYLGATNLIPGWTGTYGAAGFEAARSVVQTVDGGYALAGSNYSAGSVEFCLVKTDSAGNVQWSRNYGIPTADEAAYSLIQTTDGGYAMAGRNSSGNVNFCLVKTDSAGNVQWSRNYGGTGYEEAYSLVQTADGGYALAGSNNTGGSYYFCLVKADSGGTVQWSKNYGIPTGTKAAYSVVQTIDGGYALAGYNYSAGSADFCLVKATYVGVMQWSKDYGGASNEVAASLVQTADGGYAMAGYNSSSGSNDFCLAKVDFAGSMEWSKNYGGTGSDDARSIVQTSDCGYALAGCTYSLGVGGDFWLVKTDTAGNIQWSRNYGGAGFDLAYSLVQAVDGGYVLAGSTQSFGVGGDFWSVKTDSEMGLALTNVAEKIVTLYRGSTDLYWNYVHVRIWTIKEPSWIYGDINMDGVVDAKDLYILSRNYGQTFSLLSLTGIIAVAGVHTVKKRKQKKIPDYIS